ncbi:hypothetical protein G6M89_04560 [Natronolimnobius sp. AArcel1]|uniref:DUF7269 family protein n=1 Tax=Natronolimnobius sp. AArcel1 TaxID=1679093 RepID=UPI0013EA1D9F|nr:phage holin family protein [Natronolimnobius sp. AArcel1]NGM68288.1 hypothetical protein [Natronolimnobius sp. AArcel1]
MSDRSISVFQPIAWVRTADSERLALAVIAGSVLFTLAVITLGGFVQFGSGIIAVLYTLATVLPVVGVLLAAGALWWGLSTLEPAEPPLAAAEPPEQGETRTNQPVARETIWTLERATSNWYHCRNEGATAEIHEQLTDGVVRTLRSKGGLEETRAREAVQSGTWTDDRVASAFLADDQSQPIGERLRGFLDPGAAFDRRLRRTLAAIETIDDNPRWQPPTATEAASESTDSASLTNETEESHSPSAPATDSIDSSDSTAGDSRTANTSPHSSESVQEVAR